MKLLSTAVSLLIGLVAVTAAPMAIAQDYPKKPVTIYVPFAAGGITDVLGRIVAQELSTSLHGQFVVENKPGGGTAVATMATINAEQDGYTLLMVPNATLSTNPTLYKSLPYQPLQDLKPIALVGSIPFLLLASTQFAAKSIPELIKMARENPGKINYGSGGAGTNGAIFMDMFQTMTGTKMVHIPYRGSSPQLTDTISGQVQIGFADASTTKDIVLAGKLRALGVSSEKRFEGLPEVPTLSEAGVTGFNAEILADAGRACKDAARHREFAQRQDQRFSQPARGHREDEKPRCDSRRQRQCSGAYRIREVRRSPLGRRDPQSRIGGLALSEPCGDAA